jgi:phenylalanyl-tRNA synthetase beta chain
VQWRPADGTAGDGVAGTAELQIVCGARNARRGLVTALATVGAKLPGGLAIGRSKLRGVESAGMLCSAKELGLAEASDGILELPDDAPIGADLRDWLALDDASLELNVTPNRGDAMSVLGVARDVAALCGVPLRGPRIEPVPPSLDERLAVALAAPAACPRFAGRILRGLDPAATTPLWLRERLRRAGVRAIHPVVDVTNYVMLELGQPMHAYDLGRLRGGLAARLAEPGERCTLLDGREVSLDPDMLVIADAEGPVGLAGVMGGARTAVSGATTDVFLEAAHFAPGAIAGRGRRLGLTTDASQRFERGVDPALPARAIERAAALIRQIAGGRAGPSTLVEGETGTGDRARIALRSAAIARILGVGYPEARIETILGALGFGLDRSDGGWSVAAPSYRFDVTIERDLIEEIARVAGYDSIPEADARIAQRMRVRPAQQSAALRWYDTLAARGYQEAITFAFVDSHAQRLLFPDREPIRLSNPIASDLDAMRVSLWPGLMRAALENRRRQASRVRLFEHGVVFEPGPDGPIEAPRIAGLAWGARVPEQWGAAVESVDFHDLRRDVEALSSCAGDGEPLSFVAAALPCLHPGRAARLERAGRAVGWLGELHPELVRTFEFGTAPLLFELDPRPGLAVKSPPLEEVSRFPQVRRDLSIEVPEALPFSAIRDRVTLSASSRLRDLTVFDVYRGPGVEPGLKRLALGLIFQEKSRTLTDAETDGLVAGIRADLVSTLNARIRE